MTDWMSAAVRGAASVQDKLVVLYVGRMGRLFVKSVPAFLSWMKDRYPPRLLRIGCGQWTC